MAKKDRVHQLIQSLSPSEKRYFKVYIKRNILKNSSNYLVLFNRLNAMEEYDGALLKRQLKGAVFVRQLSVTKHYLYGHILKSLELFYYQADVDKRLSSYKTQIGILHDRGLHEHAKKLTDKALRLATENELFMDVAELTLLKSTDLTRSLELRDLEERLEMLNWEIENALAQQQLRMRLEHLDNKALLLIKKYGMVRDEEGLELFRSLAEHPSMDKAKLNTFLQWYFYHHIMSLYHFATEREAENYTHRKKLVQLFEAHPEKKESHTSKYITALNNLALVCNMQQRDQEYEQTLATLERLQPQKKADQVKVFTNALTMRLMTAFNKQDFAYIVFQTEFIKQKRAVFGDRVDLSNWVLFYYLLAAAHLAEGHAKAASNLLHELLNIPRCEEIQDLYRFARVLLLLAHYKLGNQLLLESQTQSLYQYLKTKKKMYQGESLLMELIGGLSRSSSKAESIKALGHFLAQYGAVKTSQFEQRIDAYFPFYTWVEKELALLNK